MWYCGKLWLDKNVKMSKIHEIQCVRNTEKKHKINNLVVDIEW